MNAWSDRTDYFTKAGVSGFPQTFEDFITAAGKLKSATGKPMAQTVGHAYGDSLTMWLPVLWAHGASGNAQNGEATSNSAATLQAVHRDSRDHAAGAGDPPDRADAARQQCH